MAKEVMVRKASDNEYLHKDFHLSMNRGIDYLHRIYGDQAVREYLIRFAKKYHKPLIEDLEKRGLIALKEYFENIYKTEGTKAEISFNEDELIISIDSCPAIEHINKNKVKVAELFYETTKTVNEALCEGTPYSAELIGYNPETGGGKQRFYRR